MSLFKVELQGYNESNRSWTYRNLQNKENLKKNIQFVGPWRKTLGSIKKNCAKHHKYFFVDLGFHFQPPRIPSCKDSNGIPFKWQNLIEIAILLSGSLSFPLIGLRMGPWTLQTLCSLGLLASSLHRVQFRLSCPVCHPRTVAQPWVYGSAESPVSSSLR